MKRTGGTNNSCYRVVVMDQCAQRDGKAIEEIGFYNPMTEPAEVNVDAEKAKKWISNGAQPTETVKDLLKKSGVID
jgi:small subunit ribosomal protein S16